MGLWKNQDTCRLQTLVERPPTMFDEPTEPSKTYELAGRASSYCSGVVVKDVSERWRKSGGEPASHQRGCDPPTEAEDLHRQCS
jgi:hypothetical protein